MVTSESNRAKSPAMRPQKNNLNKLLLVDLMDCVITRACRMHKLLSGFKRSTGHWNRKWTNACNASGRRPRPVMLAGVELPLWLRPLVCPGLLSQPVSGN